MGFTKSELYEGLKVGMAVVLGSIVLLGALIILSPLVWGVKFGSLDSGSMGPTIPQGSLIIILPTEPAKIVAGDVISYRPPGSSTVVTHRVASTVGEGERLSFRTQGDANENTDGYLVPADRLVGRVWRQAPHLGSVADVMRGPAGFIGLILVPAVGLLLLELRRLKSKQPIASTTSNTEPIREHATAPIADGGVEPR